ncbi:MAG: sulfotransferase [Methylococcaceae bacterium]
MFYGNYRATHEDDAEILLDLIMNAAAGTFSPTEFRRFLFWRDRRLLTEMDSSGLNIHFLEHLRDLFPEARFILTLRDSYSWLESQINHIIARPPQDNPRVDYSRFQDFHYRWQEEPHPPEEYILKTHGLYTLDHFLGAYAWHNRKALTCLPAERLLVIRTHEIKREASRIAAFAGVPLDTLNLERAHSYPAQTRYDVLQHIDRDYLEAKIRWHCGELMAEWFADRPLLPA